MKTFKTPKGTELPLRNMHGKDYLDVQYRVLWMREDHPDWGIETHYLELNENSAIAKATIRDGQGRILAQGTKTETPSGFADFVEKAETGSVGRALALCGYGTQFAQELEEGERIVDSPREPKQPLVSKGSPLKDVSTPLSDEPGSYIIKCAPYKDKRLSDIGQHDLNAWCQRWRGKQIAGALLEGINQAEKYLNFVERPRAATK